MRSNPEQLRQAGGKVFVINLQVQTSEQRDGRKIRLGPCEAERASSHNLNPLRSPSRRGRSIDGERELSTWTEFLSRALTATGADNRNSSAANFASSPTYRLAFSFSTKFPGDLGGSNALSASLSTWALGITTSPSSFDWGQGIATSIPAWFHPGSGGDTSSLALSSGDPE